MSYLAIAVIFVICAALALFVSLPFIWVVRALRRRKPVDRSAPRGRGLSIGATLVGLLQVVLLFFVFAQQYIAPTGWLGARVATAEGRFWFWVLATLVFAVVGHLWRVVKAQIASRRRRR